MKGGKCGKGKGLCPVSFGLAIGVTCGLAVLLWTAWAMYVGWMPVTSMYAPPADWAEAFSRAFWCLVKGFFFGFFVALIYDCITRCCPGKCCKSSDDESGCCK